MKKFKQIDAWISVGLISTCAAVTISAGSTLYLIYSYFIIGGWQVASMLVHTFNGWFMKKGARSWYHKVTLGILIITPVSYLVPPLAMMILCLLLVVSPVLAITYTSICFDELRELKMAHSLNLK